MPGGPFLAASDAGDGRALLGKASDKAKVLDKIGSVGKLVAHLDLLPSPRTAVKRAADATGEIVLRGLRPSVVQHTVPAARPWIAPRSIRLSFLLVPWPAPPSFLGQMRSPDCPVVPPVSVLSFQLNGHHLGSCRPTAVDRPSHVNAWQPTLLCAGQGGARRPSPPVGLLERRRRASQAEGLVPRESRRPPR